MSDRPVRISRTDTRDVRAIAQFTCPVCGAQPGRPCTMDYTEHDRPRCHLARRKANQERLRQESLSTNPLHKGNPK